MRIATIAQLEGIAPPGGCQVLAAFGDVLPADIDIAVLEHEANLLQAGPGGQSYVAHVVLCIRTASPRKDGADCYRTVTAPAGMQLLAIFVAAQTWPI